MNYSVQSFSFVALDVATGKKTTIAPYSRVGQILCSSWLPDGSGLLVAFSGPSTNFVPQVGFVSYPAGDFRRVTNDLNSYADTISTTHDGRLLVSVASENLHNIWVMPASGTAAQATQISSGRAEGASLDWTPDQRILSATMGFQGSVFDLRKSDGSGKTAVLEDSVLSFQPSACGDGRAVVFTSARGQHGVSIWRMDANGGNLKELTPGPFNSNPICSPDGQWLVFMTLNDSGNAILKIPIDGGTPVSLSPQTAFGAAVSPDGNLIALWSVEGAVPNIHNVWRVVPSTGGAPLYTLVADVRDARRRLRFTPDGKSLAYIVNEGGVSNLWAMPLTGGSPKQLTDFKSDLIFDFAWSRDGKLLALSRGQINRDVVLLTDTSK
jgi:Tol biopolymer transport system component